MKQTEQLRKVIETALKDYDEAVSADYEQRDLAADDVRFTFDEEGQWEELARERRKGKPMYTINQVAAAVNETIGNYRQNQIEMKALPEQDQSKEEAETYNGLIRGILANQDAEAAKDNAFKFITVAGFSAVRVLNQYTPDNPFQQDVCIDPIYDAIQSVWFDPNAQHMTGKDGRYVFQTAELAREEFERLYPDASMRAWPDAQFRNYQSNWGLCSKADNIKIADYYVKEPVKVGKTLLSDGSIMLTEEYAEVAQELSDRGITLADSKEIDTFKVMHYKMSGAEVLEPPVELPTNKLPIIRGLGYHEWREGCLRYRGIVRFAKDPQRVLNYATSANIEAYALAPKDKVLGTKKMFVGHETTWRNLNTTGQNMLTYTPDPEAPDGKPIPFTVQGGSPELVQQAQQAQLDLQSTIGRRAPAQRESASDRSGRAILALQRQDDAVTFELLDNLAIMWGHVASVAMDMIPKIYDTERQFMILGDDGNTEVVTLNETVKDDETGKEYRKHDTSKRYRIKTTVGPAFETKRSEVVNVLSTLMQDDTMKPMIADLFSKNLDFPFAEEMAKRFRKQQLQQGIVEPTDEEIEEAQKAAQTPEAQQAAQMQQMIQQMQIQQQQLALERQALENANLQANIANLQAATMEKLNKGAKDNADIEETRVDVYTKQVDAIVKQIEKGIPVDQAQLQALQQSIQLLDATQREEFNRRIQQALNQANQIRPQS